MLGEVGDGFKIAMSALDSGRYSVAAGVRGDLPGSLDASVRYSKEREQFGRPIASFQLVQEMLADIKVQTDAARMLVWRAGYLKDSGQAEHDRDLDRQAVRHRGGRQLRQHRDPGPRWLGLRRRLPGRALLPRRPRDDPVRGDLADPEADHRPLADRDQRAGPCLSAPRVDAPRHDRRRRRRDDGRRASPSSAACRAPGRCCTTRSPRRWSAASSGSSAISSAGAARGRLDARPRREAAAAARAGAGARGPGARASS